MKEVVLDMGGELGPLTPVEFERALGFPDGAARVTAAGRELPEWARYKVLGNSFAVPVMMHLQVSALQAKGIITRDDARQDGQTWVVNQDGPVGAVVWQLVRGVQARSSGGQRGVGAEEEAVVSAEVVPAERGGRRGRLHSHSPRGDFREKCDMGIVFIRRSNDRTSPILMIASCSAPNLDRDRRGQISISLKLERAMILCQFPSYANCKRPQT